MIPPLQTNPDLLIVLFATIVPPNLWATGTPPFIPADPDQLLVWQAPHKAMRLKAPPAGRSSGTISMFAKTDVLFGLDSIGSPDFEGTFPNLKMSLAPGTNPNIQWYFGWFAIMATGTTPPMNYSLSLGYKYSVEYYTECYNPVTQTEILSAFTT